MSIISEELAERLYNEDPLNEEMIDQYDLEAAELEPDWEEEPPEGFDIDEIDERNELEYRDQVCQDLISVIDEYLQFSTFKDLIRLITENF